MKRIDVRLNETETEIIRSFVGKTFQSYAHEPFVFTNSVSQAVRFTIDSKDSYLYSFTEECDYFGTTEDVALWSVEINKYPFIDKKNFVATPVGQIIKGVVLIQENQRLFANGSQTYDVWLTRGIIFDLGDHQISFEKGEWLMENIIIRKGYNLIDEFSPVCSFTEKWDCSVIPECSRETVEIF